MLENNYLENQIFTESEKQNDYIKRVYSINDRKNNLAKFIDDFKYQPHVILEEILFINSTSIAYTNNALYDYIKNFKSLNGYKRVLEKCFKIAFRYTYLMEYQFDKYVLDAYLKKNNVTYNIFDAVLQDFINIFGKFEEVTEIIENNKKSIALEKIKILFDCN